MLEERASFFKEFLIICIILFNNHDGWVNYTRQHYAQERWFLPASVLINIIWGKNSIEVYMDCNIELVLSKSKSSYIPPNSLLGLTSFICSGQWRQKNIPQWSELARGGIMLQSECSTWDKFETRARSRSELIYSCHKHINVAPNYLRETT